MKCRIVASVRIAAILIPLALVVAAPVNADPPAVSSGAEITPPSPDAKQESTAPQNGAPVVVGSTVAILGKKVRGPGGENFGLIVDVLVDNDGMPRAAVIDFGGFLGVGSRKVSVDWKLLHFKPDDKDAPILLAMSRAQIQASPEFKESAAPPQSIAAPPPPKAISTDGDK